MLIEEHFAEGLQHVAASVATQGTPAHFAILLVHKAELALCALHVLPPSGSVHVLVVAGLNTHRAPAWSVLPTHVSALWLLQVVVPSGAVHVATAAAANMQVLPAASFREGLSTSPLPPWTAHREASAAPVTELHGA